MFTPSTGYDHVPANHTQVLVHTIQAGIDQRASGGIKSHIYTCTGHRGAKKEEMWKNGKQSMSLFIVDQVRVSCHKHRYSKVFLSVLLKLWKRQKDLSHK